MFLKWFYLQQKGPTKIVTESSTTIKSRHIKRLLNFTERLEAMILIFHKILRSQNFCSFQYNFSIDDRIFLGLLDPKMHEKFTKSEKKKFKAFQRKQPCLIWRRQRKKRKKSKSMFLAFIVEALLITKQNTLKAIACGHIISEVYKSRYGKS